MTWSLSRPRFGRTTATTAVALVLYAGGCAGERDAPADTAAALPAPAAGLTATSGTAASGAITSQLIALGDSVYHGQVGGGTCQTCHGPDAKGTQLAPNLTDAQWLNGDGSHQSIVNIVMTGVQTPKQYPGLMPPKGGAPLTDDQARAVAAYVYSLSHPGR